MKDKKDIIIEAAMGLFAQKGFTSTSIHEIAKASNISKGAFYLHFKSKDELLVSILTKYFDTIEEDISRISKMDLPAREAFTLQLNSIYQTLLRNKEFIIMQTREQFLPLNEEIQKLIYNFHMQTLEFYKVSLLEIYGRKVTSYLWDLTILLDGLLQTYIKFLLIEEDVNTSRTYIEYILKRIDDFVVSLTNEASIPIIDKTKVKSIYKTIFFENKTIQLREVMELLQEEVSKVVNNTDLQVSLDVIDDELSGQAPRIPVILGMLSNFSPFPQFEEYICKIKKLLADDVR